MTLKGTQRGSRYGWSSDQLAELMAVFEPPPVEAGLAADLAAAAIPVVVPVEEQEQEQEYEREQEQEQEYEREQEQEQEYEREQDDGPGPPGEALLEIITKAVTGSVNALLRQPCSESAVRISYELRCFIRVLEDDWEGKSNTLYQLLSYCLFGFRLTGLPVGPVINWISRQLGPEAGEQAQLLGSLIGYPFAPVLPPDDLRHRLEHEMETVMFWLVAGVVASAGRGDADWLRQFIPSGLYRNRP